MTSPQQIKVMELEGYSRQCAFSHDAFDRRRCNPQADQDEFVDHTNKLKRRLAVAKFSKSKM